MNKTSDLELALASIPKVQIVAQSLVCENPRRTVCSKLAAELCLAVQYLNLVESSPDQDTKHLANISKLLRDIEKIICSPRTSDKNLPCLREIAKESLATPRSQAKSQVRRGLLSFSKQERVKIEQGLARIRKITKTGGVKVPVFGDPDEGTKSTPDDCLDAVTATTYDVLREHMYCECADEAKNKSAESHHHASLLLQHALPKKNNLGGSRFDLLLCSAHREGRSPLSHYWQDSELLVMNEAEQPASDITIVVDSRHCDEPNHEEGQFHRGQPHASGENVSKLHIEDVPPGALCGLIRQDYALWLRLIIRAGKLQHRVETVAARRKIKKAPSISFAGLIGAYALDITTKLSLAFVLAQSVWYLYDSDWMRTPWTRDSIHFFEERVSNSARAASNPCSRPHLSVRFDSTDIGDSDIEGRDGVLHRYPRIRSLGILLVEIAQGRLLRHDGDQSSADAARTNGEFSLAWTESISDQVWEGFNVPKYRTAVRYCLDHNNFQCEPPARDKLGLAEGIRRRRQLLYENVVYPLFAIMDKTGWMDTIDDLPPLKPLTTTAVDGHSSARTIDRTGASSAVHRPSSKRSDCVQLDGHLSATKASTDEWCMSASVPPQFIQGDITPLSKNAELPSSDAEFRKSFRIAMICALQLEGDAVEAMFDSNWEDQGIRCGKAPDDPNSYSTGRIGTHNVVLVHMPKMGTVEAASVSSSLKRSFPALELSLVVGICGGMPMYQNRRGAEEIVLGDIVVSTGLVRYDSGRQYPAGVVPRSKTSDDPTPRVQAFLKKLKGPAGRARLSRATIRWMQVLRGKEGFEDFEYPGATKDKLYQPSYHHMHPSDAGCAVCSKITTPGEIYCPVACELSCAELGCDQEQLVRRRRLQVSASTRPEQRFSGTINEPKIHFGLMASGNLVMKSSKHRDDHALTSKVIAFEMEGAGVWSNVPTLIVKSVCDYADSHKDKIWQDYAAGTAAACAKALLGEWD